MDRIDILLLLKRIELFKYSILNKIDQIDVYYKFLFLCKILKVMSTQPIELFNLLDYDIFFMVFEMSDFKNILGHSLKFAY
jgi:hypothetical protein